MTKMLSSSDLMSAQASEIAEKCTGTHPVTGDEFTVYVRKKTVGDVLQTADAYQNGQSIRELFAHELARGLLNESNKPIFTAEQLLNLKASSGWFAELSEIYLRVNPPENVKKN